MAYKLSELKKQVPGIASNMPGKPATPHSPTVQRRLDLAIAVHEGFLTDSGTPRSMRAEAELAIDAMHLIDRERTAEQTQLIGQTATKSTVQLS